jgi:hypothetical protein
MHMKLVLQQIRNNMLRSEEITNCSISFHLIHNRKAHTL